MAFKNRQIPVDKNLRLFTHKFLAEVRQLISYIQTFNRLFTLAAEF